MTTTPDTTPTHDSTTITGQERAAARAFQSGAKTLRDIAALLGTTEDAAAAWLESDRLTLACATIKRSNAHPRKKKP